MFTYLFLFFITFLPVVFWGYIFSYIDSTLASRKNFILWVVAGGVSVLPVLYFASFMEVFNLPILNVFYYVSQVGNIVSLFPLSLSLSLLILLILFVSFLLGFFLRQLRDMVFVYAKNFFVFFCFLVFLSWIFYILNLLFSFFPEVNFDLWNNIIFWDLVFDSLKLIIFYYFLIGVIEEAAKHFHFLNTGIFAAKNEKSLVLFSIFVALWFAFIENILYFKNLYEAYGISGELVKTYFFRSIFSMILHILCSSIIAFSFAKVFMKTQKQLSFQYVKVFFIGIALSVFLHAFFDIALSVGLWFVMFIYFVGGYLYVSSIFYKDDVK